MAPCHLRRRPARASLAALLACAAVCAAADQPAPKPKPVRPPSAEAVEKAIRRGADFLLRRQNPGGSWGSARNTKGLNVYAPVPGAHHAFRAAVTSLCVSALIESGDDRPAARKAIGAAEAWLVQNLPSVRRATPRAVYNNWAHAYGIQALVRLLRRPDAEGDQAARLLRLIRQQIDLLGRYEAVNGGWGYYDFRYRTQKPGGAPTSFLTATVLVALHEARQAGVAAPQKIVERAVAAVRRQQKPDCTYLYAEPLKWRPMFVINRPGGSLGRSQACNLAMRLWGDERISDEVLGAWLDRLFARNCWLDMGRKRPVPHESWFQVAGYFFYYGHFYAALCIDELPAGRRPHFQGHLAHILVRLQEKDGSWWDFPFYDYHQQYGTAMAVMSLVRCRRRPPAPARRKPGPERTLR